MNLAFGDAHVEFEPPQGIVWQVLGDTPDDPAAAKSCAPAVNDLLDQLTAQGLAHGCRLLLIIPDHTRRCRIDEILRLLLPGLQKRFKPKVEILIANGSHVLQPESVIRELVGDDILQSYSVEQHDSRDQSALDDWGMSSLGTPIYLNKKVKVADFIITIGGVLYHYFAGFGGGPKMLMPGVAGYETIRYNHQRTIDADSGAFQANCRTGHLDTNPVFTDLAEIAALIPNVLSLQVVLNPQKDFVFCQAGPWPEVHRRACECVQATYNLAIERQADVVVASAGGFPSDVNLIQAHKSLHHAFQAVREHGCIVLLAECREGIGSATFMPYFEAGDAKAIGRQLLQDFRINGQTALALRTKAEKATVCLVSSLDPGLVTKTGMIPASSLAQAWSQITSKLATNPFGYIMPKASTHFPVLAR